MKATELRVNNLVHFGLSNIVRVESINTHTCICKAKYSRSGKDVFEDMISFSGDTASGNAPIESFWGIPLTEEILLKCGFSYRNCPPCGQDQWANMGIWSLILPSGTYLTLRGGIKDIKVIYPHGTAILYLHQLQNLYFALSGQELEVNL